MSFIYNPIQPPTTTTLGGVKSKAAVGSNFLTSIGTDGSVGQAQPAASDLSGTLDGIADGTTYLRSPNYSGLLVENGNFINGTAGWHADPGSMAQDTTSPFTNGKSLKVTTAGQYNGAFSRRFAVNPGDSFYFSAWAKSDGVAPPRLQVNELDSLAGYVGTIGPIDQTLSTTWTKYSTTATVNANTAFLEIQLLRDDAGGGSQSFWVTDVELRRVLASTELSGVGGTVASAGPFTTISSITTVNGIVTALTGTSDERLKNSKPYITGLDAVLAINPIQFSWNEKGQDHAGLPAGQEFIGFSAQDVQKVIPLAITGTEGEEEYLSLDTRPIIAALVNAVRELATQNKELTARVKELEGK